MKVIFLDIDGVLNSTTDFMEKDYVEDHPYNHGAEVISPGKLALLEEILKQTDAKIVVSSTWRELFSIKELYDMFVERGFTFPRTVFVGRTESSGFSLSGDRELYGRTHRISEWLEKRDDIEAYVIIDDMEQHLFNEEHHEHFVQTDFHNGLNYYSMKRAIDILGRNEEYQKKQDDYDKTLNLLIGCMV
jgi:hypothetical protein